MNRLFFLLGFLSACGTLFGQTAEDALRYSFVTPMGTARYAGTGGALSPLGVDFTTTSTNPAGIGWARNGYVVITPGFKIESIESSLINDANPRNQSQDVNQFALPSIGVLFPSQTNSLYWSTLNFAVGLNRIADFNETIFFRGNSAGSIMESFVEDANDGIFNDFRNELAFDPDVNAILEDSLGFFSDFDSNPDGIIRREGIVTRTGSMNEFVLSIGGNYREKLMWGLTLGVPFLNFRETREYDEIDENDEILFFDDLSFNETLENTGSGVNFKIGFIYRATQALRISLAAHTPTFWSIDETYETDFTYNFTDEDGAQGGTAQSPRSEITYNLQTPWRLMGGIGAIINKKGFVSLDVEYVSYAANKFSFDDFTVEAEAANEEVDNLLESGFSARLGGEYNLKPLLLRAGFGVRQSPIIGDDEVYLNAAIGAGYRFDRYFIDAAYTYNSRERIFQPYSTFAVEPQQVNSTFTRHNFLLSAGVFF
ncbi:MAG: outer membrane protein transport protein [Bacteroidota bacterium]